jgi:hypothetical protein
MTFLELCQRLVQKTDISGAITSVLNQRGDMKNVVNWINEAWYDIQMLNPNWKWMRYEFSFQAVAGRQEYPVADTNATLFRRWHRDTIRIQRTATGASDNRGIDEVNWDDFRTQYIYGTQTPATPLEYAVRPRDSALFLGPAPDGDFTVFGEYQRMPYYLADNTQSPDMPEEYHWLIVHAARKKYAYFENAPEVLSEASSDYNRVYDTLVMEQLADMTSAGPLA